MNKFMLALLPLFMLTSLQAEKPDTTDSHLILEVALVAAANAVSDHVVEEAIKESPDSPRPDKNLVSGSKKLLSNFLLNLTIKEMEKQTTD